MNDEDMQEDGLGGEGYSAVSGTLIVEATVVGAGLTNASREIGDGLAKATAPFILSILNRTLGPVSRALMKTKKGPFDNWGLRVGYYEGYLLGGPVFYHLAKSLGFAPSACEFLWFPCGLLFLGPLTFGIMFGFLVWCLRCIIENRRDNASANATNSPRSAEYKSTRSNASAANGFLKGFIRLLTVFICGYVGYRFGYAGLTLGWVRPHGVGHMGLDVIGRPYLAHRFHEGVEVFYGIWGALILAVLGDPLGKKLGDVV